MIFLKVSFKIYIIHSCYYLAKTSHVKIRKIFKFSKIGNIAGCKVTKGVVKNHDKARLVRDGIVIYDGSIASIQHEKDQVKEVKKDMECGITLENYQDIKEGDIIEAYQLVEIKR